MLRLREILALSLIAILLAACGSGSATHPTPTPQIGPVCARATAPVSVYEAPPKAGPATPPAVEGTPAKNPDGLQCLDLVVGKGATAHKGQTVLVEYTGWLESTGQKFDSTYDRGSQPFTVSPLGQAQVIPGWNEGLVGMRVGGTRRLIIPSALGYGPTGNGPIPANATLIFDITLLRVQ